MLRYAPEFVSSTRDRKGISFQRNDALKIFFSLVTYNGWSFFVVALSRRELQTHHSATDVNESKHA